ncbi:hypothetical protein V6N13_013030 [Hibiscus sabdariffa]
MGKNREDEGLNSQASDPPIQKKNTSKFEPGEAGNNKLMFYRYGDSFMYEEKQLNERREISSGTCTWLQQYVVSVSKLDALYPISTL